MQLDRDPPDSHVPPRGGWGGAARGGGVGTQRPPPPPVAPAAAEPMTRAMVLGRLRKGRKIRLVVGEVERALSEAGWKVDARVVKRKSALRRSAADAVK